MSFKAVLLIVVAFRCCLAYYYNIDNLELSNCNSFSTNNISYHQYFEIEKLPPTSILMVDFHFSVLASNNIRLVFTSEKYDKSYEVIIGDRYKSFCAIQCPAGVTKIWKEVDFLSKDEVRSFWIHITRDGSFYIGKEGSIWPFLLWNDPEAYHNYKFYNLQYVAFATDSATGAQFYYNCFNGFNTKITSKRIDQVQTNPNLQANRSPQAPPLNSESGIKYESMPENVASSESTPNFSLFRSFKRVDNTNYESSNQENSEQTLHTSPPLSPEDTEGPPVISKSSTKYDGSTSYPETFTSKPPPKLNFPWSVEESAEIWDEDARPEAE